MIHLTVRIIQVIAVLGCCSSFCYYLICLWSASRFLSESRAGQKNSSSALTLPPISILKPLKGIDPEIYECFRSHCLQDYPEYEIVFGVSDPKDPAVASVEQLQRDFPSHEIRLVVCPQILGANVKVSNLEQMLPHCRHEYLIVNDSDIRVEPDYLRRIIPPLTPNDIGMVTCPYRGIAAPTLGSKLESLGISTDFFPGVLAAKQIEDGLRFGLGSTLAFRRRDLQQIGGFKSIVDYLADDYELGRRISDLGLKVALSDVVVETHLPAYDWTSFLAHQMRWARGVRDARLGGYIGLASTFGLFWSLLNLIAFRAAPWSIAMLAAMCLVRGTVAMVIGSRVLRDRQVLREIWLLPIRDLIAVGVWVASFTGHTVTWRGDRFELRNGRLNRVTR
ncbi:MAG TPA: bacteriohopanetetrol glucosamine biosynthesis glycosyltransferase HpnI [Candidatus Sulfotelmatobacter sp.]|nr:bacteriohopanetetrol glucosamine biosynthesis glycosyltransferase HpnI [Candidatus Sulfotelmatobacter sp.]